MSDYTHPAVMKRHYPISIFSVAIWSSGVVLTILTTVATRSLGSLGILVAALLIGLPLPDIGPPHNWVIREWRRRAQWRRDQGRMMVPALQGEPPGPPCDIERIEGVLARVNTRDAVAYVPLFTDKIRDYVTIALRLSGASPQWVQSDTDGKFDWNLAWFEGIAQALGITNDPDVEVFFTHMHRPADIETMLRLAKVRYDPDILDAAIIDPDSVEGRLGQNISDRIDLVYGMAGQPREYVFLRTPWPRGWRGKIGVGDADAFQRTSLFRMISEIKGVYEQLGITAELLLPGEAQELWDEFFNVTDLPAIRMYRQRDRELERLQPLDANAEPEPEVEEFELKMAQSLRSSSPDELGYLCYGGTFHLAGYVKQVKTDRLRPAFRRGFHLDDDVYWTITVHVKAKLRDIEAKKTREKERGLNITEDLNPLKRGVTDPEGDRRWYDVVSKRHRLLDASNRVPRTITLVSVAGSSLKEAEARWADMVVRSATVYEIVRVHHRDDIEDILLAQLGLRLDSL